MTFSSHRRAVRLSAGLAAAVLVTAGCGSEDSATTRAADAASSAAADASSRAAAAASSAAAAPSTAPPAPTGSPKPGAKPVLPEVTNATDNSVAPVIAAAGPDAGRPTELLTEDLIKGTGKVAGKTDTVEVRYVGAIYRDGQPFDSSWGQEMGDPPASFSLLEVVPGFAQGITGMKEGGRRLIVIPAELGYGAGGGGPIPPDSDLVFVVDLVKTTPAAG